MRNLYQAIANESATTFNSLRIAGQHTANILTKHCQMNICIRFLFWQCCWEFNVIMTFWSANNDIITKLILII